MDDQYILSICIPTYNRAEYLERSLDSLFTVTFNRWHDFEVVVSDNCSTDTTELVCNRFSQMYSNFRYFKTERNLVDGNFPEVVLMAKGLYRKIYNDTCIYNDSSITTMLSFISRYKNSRPLLLFVNRSNHLLTYRIFNRFSDVFNELSFHVTWLGNYGIWSDDIEEGISFRNGLETKLWQVDNLLRQACLKTEFVLVESNFVEVQKVENKDLTYGFVNVFLLNYLRVLREFERDGLLNKKLLIREEKNLLFYHFSDIFIDSLFKRQKFNFQTRKELCVLWNFYRTKCYFYFFGPKFLKRIILRFVKSI